MENQVLPGLILGLIPSSCSIPPFHIPCRWRYSASYVPSDCVTVVLVALAESVEMGNRVSAHGQPGHVAWQQCTERPQVD